MRVDVTPKLVSTIPGRPSVITITVSNTAAIISGHEIKVLGVDPQWVHLDQTHLSLFPDTSGVAVLTVNLPEGIPAGSRQVDVEVRELTAPNDLSRTTVTLTVPAELNVSLALDPVSTTGGRTATVGVVIENTGNAVADVDLAGLDEEGLVAFAFTPEITTLSPGEQSVGTARLKAKRPWFGSPKVRPYTVQTGPQRAPVIAYGAWVQSPMLSRGKLALAGLVAAATVFAVVIAATLSGLGHKSNQDLALALQVAQASTETHTGGTSGLSGTVRQLSNRAPVSGITVTLFQSSNTSNPVVSTATGSNGGYHFKGLSAGSYKVEFDGSGFTQIWYPKSLGAANAEAVSLQKGKTAAGINVYLGGIPATISGQVTGGDPTGALLTLETPTTPATTSLLRPRSAGAARAPAQLTSALVEGPPVAAAKGGPAVVMTETLDATGDFVLAGVPSPAVYDLVVTKTGYATTTQTVDLGGGEDRTGVTIELHEGDGSITGVVSSHSGGLDGATITASDGTTTINTVSLTKAGKAGTFVLSGLPTPDTLTLDVSASGYKSQTLAVTLAADQQLTGVAVTLTSGVGTISGTVTTPAGTPTGGVTVTATNGSLVETTVTLSTGKIGTYSIGGLPVPGSYTLTFSRSDLESQTRAEALTPTSPSAANVDADLELDTATVEGVVSQSGTGPVGNVTVTVNSGTTTYTVTTATNAGPGTTVGSYEIQGIVPGTYTVSFSLPGVLPVSSVIDLAAGHVDTESPTLETSASITGQVVFANSGEPATGAEVDLYLTSQYPNVKAQTETIGADGTFDFTGVQAPESYIVGVAYPSGSLDQETVEVTTVPEQSVAACQAAATGEGAAATTATTTGALLGIGHLPGVQLSRVQVTARPVVVDACEPLQVLAS